MSIIDVKVPDIGDFKNVPIVEILVKVGDVVSADSPLLSLESEKATMEIPAPVAGTVAEIIVKIGDRVSEGSPLLKLDAGGGAQAPTAPGPGVTAPTPSLVDVPETKGPAAAKHTTSAPAAGVPAPTDFGGVHASPSVRRLARELEIDLTRLNGTGDKGRITKDDVKAAIAGSGAVRTAGSIPDIPAQDFAKFGPIETKPLSRLKRLSGPHLHRAWLNIPHVTHSDDADITELESYRRTLDGAAKEKGFRVTMLAFLIKASVVALKEYPEFNASLSPDKESLIYKRYYNLGVAVDTPDGLVVPVIKDADRKGIIEISQELGAVSARMRDGKIAPADIQGATFSISSSGASEGPTSRRSSTRRNLPFLVSCAQ